MLLYNNLGSRTRPQKIVELQSFLIDRMQAESVIPGGDKQDE
jgi:hypothetical protein